LLFNFLKSLSLLLVFSLDTELLLFNPGHSFLELLLGILLLLLEALFISVNCRRLLVMVLLDPLLLESKSLVLQGLLSFEVDLRLSEIVHCLIIFRFQLFNFVDLSKLLCLRISFLLFKALILLR